MGHSPYVLNLGVYYQNPYKKFQLNIAYNLIGKNVFVVGTYGTPNVFEMDKNNLNLSISKSLYDKLKLTFNISNIFNTKIIMKQDSNENGKLDNKDEIVSKYKVGLNYAINISYIF